jgi:hypothetical protein
MTADQLIPVRYITCDCDWWTKTCEELHTKVALVPLEVLERYSP